MFRSFRSSAKSKSPTGNACQAYGVLFSDPRTLAKPGAESLSGGDTHDASDYRSFFRALDPFSGPCWSLTCRQ